jgi:hypothetical protein
LICEARFVVKNGVFLSKCSAPCLKRLGGWKSWSFGSSKHIRLAVPNKAVAGFDTDLAAAFLFLLSGFNPALPLTTGPCRQHSKACVARAKDNSAAPRTVQKLDEH